VDLPRIVRERREFLGLTREGLAEKSGLSRNLIFLLETGKSEPRWGSVKKLCRALDMPLWKFILEIEREDALEYLKCRPVGTCNCALGGAARILMPEAEWCPKCGNKLKEG